MAWTNSDLAAIDAALAQGVAEVKYSDRSVRYRSVDELLRAREVVVQAIAQQTGASSRKQIRIFTGSGW